MTAIRLDLCPLLIQPNDPDLRLLERVDRLGKVGARDQEMLTGARGGVDHSGRDLHGMRQRDDHAMDADGFGSSQQSSKILGIIE